MSYRSKENLDLSPPMASSSRSLDSLFDLVIRLRSPEGCPWDREQEVEDLRAYLLEEAHEVAAAIEGARSVSDLPICATLSYDTAGRTMMGVTGTDAVIRLIPHVADEGPLRRLD